MNQLSSGVIADIIEGGHPDNPLVQILSMKRIPCRSQERWRLLVSDSQWSCSFAMMATQLNNKVSSGKITNNCIVRLDRYVCNMIQDNKKVLIILDLTVTKSGEEVGGKIGEPVLYVANKTRAKQQPVTKPPPSQNQTYANKPINNNNMAGSGGTLHQNGPGQRNFPATGASQARTPSGGNVHPIASLTPYQNRRGILLSAATTSPPSLRDGEEVSFTVEEGRKGVEATNVAGLDCVCTEQYPKGLGNTVPELGVAENNVPVFDKTKFTMCLPPIQEIIKDKEIKAVVLCGIDRVPCVCSADLPGPPRERLGCSCSGGCLFITLNGGQVCTIFDCDPHSFTHTLALL
ncbi:hypothetical protein Pcinc_016547 [Petrolisthes cinctipes]|uniref:Replication factor-A protein 1 N-terminal domain-containing protein n=1 Tax=Petrolisthes cinctipes TaxID=88211 RepID=A0AAE1KQX5_PETCI|nr:hypothetical protein Pcinc_016547 [Petrolisthes cinctipes]